MTPTKKQFGRTNGILVARDLVALELPSRSLIGGRHVHWTVVISVHSPNQKLVTGGYRSSMTKSDGHSGYSESPLMKQGGAESRLMQALEKLQHEE